MSLVAEYEVGFYGFEFSAADDEEEEEEEKEEEGSEGEEIGGFEIVTAKRNGQVEKVENPPKPEDGDGDVDEADDEEERTMKWRAQHFRMSLPYVLMWGLAADCRYGMREMDVVLKSIGNTKLSVCERFIDGRGQSDLCVGVEGDWTVWEDIMDCKIDVEVMVDM